MKSELFSKVGYFPKLYPFLLFSGRTHAKIPYLYGPYMFELMPYNVQKGLEDP